MNIVIITREEFPYGSAATNRMLTYLPGLVARGHQVTVLCLFLSRKENIALLDEKGECVYNGVRIKYTSGKKCWPIGTKKYLSKAYLFLKARLKAKLFFNNNAIDIVQLYIPDVNIYERYGKLCRRLGIKYVLEKSELPNIIKQRDRFTHSLKGRRYIRRTEKAYGLFDGWILETQKLFDYYGNFFSPHAKCAIIPMTVDVDRFNKVKQFDPRYGSYIAYCGNMQEVDGISILIKAYALIQPKYPNVKLVLAGDSTDVPAQKELVISLGIKDNVFFVGRLSRDEVPQFLANATVLALASPTSERACATMPCKVGEYLCTENPVVVTGLGEINKYLKDHESAFLAQADSEEAFANKLNEVLSDITSANVVGRRGREVAIKNFSTETQVIRIEKFYNDLFHA